MSHYSKFLFNCKKTAKLFSKVAGPFFFLNSKEFISKYVVPVTIINSHEQKTMIKSKEQMLANHQKICDH